MSAHFYIDETKAKGYVVVAVRCPDGSLASTRSALRGLALPGQRSVHMKHESSRRRRLIADAIVGLCEQGITAAVFDAGRGPEPETVRRERALRSVVEQAAQEPIAHLVLDRDHTLEAKDRRWLASASRDAGSGQISYRHLALAAEPLLTLPDVVAWSWARGGEWRRRLDAVIATVTEV